MGVSAGFREFVLGQLQEAVPDVHDKRMFGGIGIYAGDYFFALIANDTLYFKVDEVTRPAFVAEGMDPFRPYGPEREGMQYYQVPAHLFEDAEAMKQWVLAAVAVSRRARGARKSRHRAQLQG